MVKFIYSEKATKFCKIFTLLWTVCTGNYVAFSEYMNFNKKDTKRASEHRSSKFDKSLVVNLNPIS